MQFFLRSQYISQFTRTNLISCSNLYNLRPQLCFILPMFLIKPKAPFFLLLFTRTYNKCTLTLYVETENTTDNHSIHRHESNN